LPMCEVTFSLGIYTVYHGCNLKINVQNVIFIKLSVTLIKYMFYLLVIEYIFKIYQL
jgi:hypothetical protein